MNRNILIPAIFLFIYVIVAGIFIYTLMTGGFQWIPALGAGLSIIMIFVKLRQIFALKKKLNS